MWYGSNVIWKFPGWLSNSLRLLFGVVLFLFLISKHGVPFSEEPRDSFMTCGQYNQGTASTSMKVCSSLAKHSSAFFGIPISGRLCSAAAACWAFLVAAPMLQNSLLEEVTSSTSLLQFWRICKTTNVVLCLPGILKPFKNLFMRLLHDDDKDTDAAKLQVGNVASIILNFAPHCQIKCWYYIHTCSQQAHFSQ